MPHNSLRWIDTELATLEALNLRRRLTVRTGPQSPAVIDMDGRQLVNFGSNDYLGLAAGSLSDAVQRAVASVGWGAGASPLVTGRGTLHAELERQLAEFEGTEAALLFPSGFAANLGTIAAMVGPGDVIFSDAKNHASIIDGCRLSGARIQVYPHANADALRQLIRQADKSRRRLIVTDGLFSMDGDLAPLVQLAALAEQSDAMLMVDEAHATGVFGEHGRGVAEHLGVEGAIDIRVGTLSKALGSIGGFVAGSQRLMDWLTNRARPYVYSTAPPEAIAAAALEALRLVRAEPERRTTLLTRAARLRQQLQQAGWSTGNSMSQIVPILIGHPLRTTQISAVLRERGFLIPGIRPPTVPEGESLLRISLSYAHTDEMLDRLVTELAQLEVR
ncbi:MAG: 8-amino-7-oxononanoate synthase [Planctomycetota bacterium]|nr:8-amino-7-oxononanoate synthase [Planctomycetota bacterium]